jgi:hypothetical protein
VHLCFPRQNVSDWFALIKSYIRVHVDRVLHRVVPLQPVVFALITFGISIYVSNLL